MKRQRCKVFLVSLLLLAMLFGCAAPAAAPEAATPEAELPEATASLTAEPTDAVTQPDPLGTAVREDSDAVNAAYAKQYFDIVFSETVTQQEFVTALERVQHVQSTVTLAATDAAAALQGHSAVSLAVAGAGLAELAAVYTQEKIDATLQGLEVEGTVAADFACALDTGLVNRERAQVLAKNEAVDAALATRLLMAVATHNGTARNMMGYTDDPETYARIMNMWNTIMAANDPASLCEDETLVNVGVQILMEGVATGFNIVDISRDGRFLPELTINYFHDDIRHLRQVIGLLNSEGIVCKVQINPEFSVYQYLPEWNDDEPTPTYKVVQMTDDFYVVNTIGYFMELEFANAEDRLAFDALIKEVAKKNSGEEGKALLYNSWWQPTYESYVEVDDTYYEVYDQTISHGTYLMRIGTLTDILAPLQELAGEDCTVAQGKYWINDAYWRYMTGEDQ